MEALGVAASVVAVVQLSVQLINTCTKYIEAATNAPKELRLILIEISALRGLLEPLKVLLGFDNDTAMLEKLLAPPVESCLKAVEELASLLCGAEILETSNPSGEGRDVVDSTHSKNRQKFTTLFKRLGWPLKQDKAKRLLDMIGVYKSTISLILSSHGM
jgi:hypothetical protein